jgi:hypothetical protein
LGLFDGWNHKLMDRWTDGWTEIVR